MRSNDSMPAPSEPCPVCGGRCVRRRQVLRAGLVGVCGHCGCWYRQPRPGAEELAGLYGDRYYDSWGLSENPAAAERGKMLTFTRLLAQIDPLLPASPTGPRRLLDVGAATGLLLTAAQQRGWRPYGVEINPYAAELLCRCFGADRIYQGELPQSPFPLAFFDAITMTDVIEHVLDIRRTLHAAAVRLRPGGILALTTPRVDSLSRRLLGAHWLHFKLEHIQYFTRAALAESLQTAGFQVITLTGWSKSLDWEYLHRQLQTYPHWLLSPLVSGLRALLPRSLRQRPLWYRCGEMLALARRNPT